MSIQLVIYLIGVVDALTVTLGIIGMVALFGGAIMIVVIQSTTEDDNKDTMDENVLRIGRVFLWCSFIMLPLAIFIPSSKTIAAMYLVPRIVENEEVQKLPDNILKLLNKKVELYIDEITTTNDNDK